VSVTPISAFRPVDPDADWEVIRERLMTALALAVPTTWTDHNAVDPGVTLAEAAAFGIADLHYRTETRPFDVWPLEVHDWLPDASRHWHTSLPAGAWGGLAAALAGAAPAGTGSGSVADVLEPLIRACGAPGDAVALLSRAPWAGTFTTAQAPAAIALLRARRVRQVAHELTDVIADAVEAARAGGGSVAARDAQAAGALALSLPLWPDELTALVRRERRRRSAQVLLDRIDDVRAATTSAAATALRVELAKQDLTADEAGLAMAAVPVPVGMLPEDFEDTDGSSRVWPPHPLQALTCEPVTAGDYARLARSHPDVGRAWAVKGQLAGVGWDGRVVAGTTVRLGALTIVVERTSGAQSDTALLREVLATAVGSEVVQPHPTWRDTLDPLDPRRLICDEVGAALLVVCPVVLQGRLVTGVGADRAATIAGALARVAVYFATGRPETREAVAGPLVDGPWPRTDQPSTGWTPGESIRFSEVVQAISRGEEILGVENLSIKVGAGPFVPSSAGSVSLDPACVPGLAGTQCLSVRLSLQGDCADA
jgi:hypothetical protein